MKKANQENLITRRQMFGRTTALAGGLLATGLIDQPWNVLSAWWQSGQAQPDPRARFRAQIGAAPITTVKITDNLVMLSGPGGNVAVLSGPDGLVAVDTFVQPAWPALKKTLDGLGGPIKAAIDTHWHLDHADNNAQFRQSGAMVIAHVKTAERLSQPYGAFEPTPEAGRPTQTFSDSYKLQANGESLELGYIPPAHTDTDIYVRFPKANVLHLGDTFFNGAYPVIDTGTGGSIGGMIAAADRGLKLADRSTKIIPGHGPLADREALTKYRDVLVTVRDRVQKLKTSGRKLEDVLAAKPTADLDETWGQGFVNGETFVTIVFNTL